MNKDQRSFLNFLKITYQITQYIIGAILLVPCVLFFGFFAAVYAEYIMSLFK